MKEHLIIFTRYPEPGKTKTRMIPALGEQGAAQLQQQMTEHTLAQVKNVNRPLSVEIQFAGGTISQMQNWLGDNWLYTPQSPGDLGQRMTSAFETAFASGMARVVIIGIDCPQLNGTLLQMAFERLQNKDLVLGPALDGGYYLVGLSRSLPELFQGIPWGTSEVFSDTLKIAKPLGVSVSLLPMLSDIDRPEDLPIWNYIQSTVNL